MNEDEMFDLWAVDIGKYFGSFLTEIEALRLAKMLIDAYGDDYAADLEIAGPGLQPNLNGPALLKRVQNVDPPSTSVGG